MMHFSRYLILSILQLFLFAAVSCNLQQAEYNQNDEDIFYIIEALKIETGTSSTGATTDATESEVTVVASGTNGATIKWTAVTNAQSYDVYYSSYDTVSYYSYSDHKSATSTEVTFTDLPGNSTIYFAVYVNISDSSYAKKVGSTVSITTGNAGASDFSVTPTAGAVTASWTAPSTSGTYKYTIFYGTSSGSLYNYKSVTDNATSYQLTGLNGGHKYYFKLYTYSSSGSLLGSSSEISTTVLGGTATASINKPTNLVGTAGKSQATLSWTDVSSTYSYSYYIYYGTSSGISTENSKTTSSSISKIISSLTNGTTYYFRVQSYYYSSSTGYVYSDLSDEISVTPSLSASVTSSTTQTAETQVAGSLTGSSDLLKYRYNLEAGHVYRVLWDGTVTGTVDIVVSAATSSEEYLEDLYQYSYSFFYITYFLERHYGMTYANYVVAPSDGIVDFYIQCYSSSCSSGTFKFYVQKVSETISTGGSYTQGTLPAVTSSIPLNATIDGAKFYKIDLSSSSTYTLHFQDSGDNDGSSYSQNVSMGIFSYNSSTGYTTRAGLWTSGYSGTVHTFTPTTSETHYLMIGSAGNSVETTPGYALNIQ